MRKSIKGFIAIFIIVLGIYFLPTTTLAKASTTYGTSDFDVNYSSVDSITDLTGLYVICTVIFVCIIAIIIAYILASIEVKKQQKINTSIKHIDTVNQNATETKALTDEVITNIKE